MPERGHCDRVALLLESIVYLESLTHLWVSNVGDTATQISHGTNCPSTQQNTVQS
jgi:hypothetical protein